MAQAKNSALSFLRRTFGRAAAPETPRAEAAAAAAPAPSLRAELVRAFTEASAAHIAIDIQRCYCDPRHPHTRQMIPGAPDRAAALAPGVNALAGAAREAGLANLWVAHVFRAAFHPPLDKMPLGDAAALARLARQELYKVRAAQGEAVIAKQHFDAFEDTPLQDLLQAGGVRTLLLTGAFYDQCVAATARSGARLGYEVYVIDDLCASTREQEIAHTREDFAARGITRIGAAGIAAHLEAARPQAHALPRAAAASF
jgi:nicotinamidase-related amidase